MKPKTNILFSTILLVSLIFIILNIIPKAIFENKAQTPTGNKK